MRNGPAGTSTRIAPSGPCSTVGWCIAAPPGTSPLQHTDGGCRAASGYNGIPSPGRRRPIDLFRDLHEANRRKAQPLAARMRPATIEEFVGQEHFFGPGKLLRRML